MYSFKNPSRRIFVEKSSIDTATNNELRVSEGNRIKRRNNSRIDSKSFVSIFLKGSSIYALKRIGCSDSTLRRIIWLIIVTLGLIGCTYHIAQFWVSYYTYPVVMNMFSIRSPEQTFPAVTVCNVNNIRREFWNCVKNGLSYDECQPLGEDGYTTEDVGREFFTENSSSPLCKVFELFNNVGEVDEYDFSDLYLTPQKYETRIKYGHQLQDFIKRCNLYGNYCNFTRISQSVSYLYGTCFTINMTEFDMEVETGYYKTGPLSGLDLVLNLEVEKYNPHIEEIGARIHVHDFHRPHDIDNHGINLLPGFKTAIAISRVVTERLPSPFPDNCHAYETGDSEEECIKRCEEDHYFATCSCYTDANLHPKGEMCDFMNTSTLCCIFESNEICECPTPCVEVAYNLQISSTIWPTKTFYENNIHDDNKESDIETYRESHLKVNIYYDTLYSTTMKQSSLYHDAEILSIIGGQLGLWLGLSLITVFEFIENIFILLSINV